MKLEVLAAIVICAIGCGPKPVALPPHVYPRGHYVMIGNTNKYHFYTNGVEVGGIWGTNEVPIIKFVPEETRKEKKL